MSETTDKWQDATGIMSLDEVRDRLSEFENINLDDFYTDGQKDWDKVVENGLTHLVKSITLENGEPIDFEIHSDNSGYVYLIAAKNGLVKIGYAKDVQSRFNQIDTSSPCRLELICSYRVRNAPKVEGELHATFARQRVKGEWFDLSGEDLEICKKLLTQNEWK